MSISYMSFLCPHRPLGGDAQLVAMLCGEQLGGVIFFQDPFDSHPHSGDIEGLLRNTKIYNVMHASNTISATMMMHTLRCGLEQGKPELFPSFFTTLQCPSVARYKKAQVEVLEKNGVAHLWKKAHTLKVKEIRQKVLGKNEAPIDYVEHTFSSQGEF